MLTREVKRSKILETSHKDVKEEDYVLKDEGNKLYEWQKASAVDHWSGTSHGPLFPSRTNFNYLCSHARSAFG